jgi:hypothetical protein
MLQLLIRAALSAGLTLLAPSLSATHALAASPEHAAPQGEDPAGADHDASGTPPMVEHNGVIRPPPTGDEDIHTDAPDPDAGHDEEVIPPPDTPSGDPNLVTR